MKFQVIPTVWGAGDEVFAGGDNEIASPTVAMLTLLAAAEAAGDVVIVDATDQQRKRMDGVVQSQADSEAALAAAQGDWIDAVYEDTVDDDGNVTGQTMVTPGRWSGAWHDGNLAQFELDHPSESA